MLSKPQLKAFQMLDRADETVRETDYDALSSRISAYIKGYLPNDTQLMELTPLILKYHILSSDGGDYQKFALNRRLKRQFFGLFLKDSNNDQNGNKFTNHHHRIQNRGHHLILNNTVLPQRGHNQQNHYHPVTSPFTQYKPPIINRGTYLRTKVITDQLMNFINEHHDQEIQIVSLGAGNDTRPFQLIPEYQNLQYFEFDFEETTRLKRLAILSSNNLSKSLNIEPLIDLPKTREEVLNSPNYLNTPNYHLIPLDLRLLTSTTSLDDLPILQNIKFDFNKPTVIISECCICYLSQQHADELLKFWYNNLKHGKYIIYEPIGNPETTSRYGEVMIKNLGGRGIEMPTLMIYGTIESQLQRFKRICPNSNIWCKDMKWISENLIEQEENDRISKLEMLDEMEELNLINSHYCLILVKW